MNGGGDEDRDKTPTARLASPPPSAESSTAQSTISRLENKYADILNKIASRKRHDKGETDDLPASSVRTRRGQEEDRERTLEADNSAVLKNSSKDEGSFSGLSKSATVIHVPSGRAKQSDANKATTKPYVVDWSKYGIDKEDTKKVADVSSTSSSPLSPTTATNGSGSKVTRNGDDRDSPTNSARYKLRNERDTSNRYKDTSDLLDSLKPTKSHYNHYGHYDNPVDSVSAYYKSKYEPAATKAAPAAAEEYSYPKAEKSSAASRRTKSYRTRKEASKERKHLTLKLSAVNMDIDSPPPPQPSAHPSSSSSASSTTSSIVPKAGGVSGRTFRTYGAARKSVGTGLTPGGYQRSQTQKLYDFDDDIYHPPTPRDNKRKEIQNVIRKYAQYDEDDLRRTTANPYSNPLKSATSANLAGVGSGASHLYSDRGGGRDPIADHYGLGAGSSYYPRNHYGYEYPSYGGALTRPPAVNAYASERGAAAVGMHNPFNPLSRTHTTENFYNPSSYLGGSSAAAPSSSRSRKNLMSFVRIWNRLSLFLFVLQHFQVKHLGVQRYCALFEQSLLGE